jgi:hypothetical protein
MLQPIGNTFPTQTLACNVHNDFRMKKRCSVRLYLQLFVGGRMSCLGDLCLFAYGGVLHISCCVLDLSFFILLFSMLRVSLDCPIVIVPSVFSNVYLLRLALIPRSAYTSGASCLNLGFCKTLCYSSFSSFIVFFTIIFVWMYAFFWY